MPPYQTMLYFAYGSNMSTRRLQQRVPSACALQPAVLQGHRLTFHKVGRDGSAKCDAAPSRDDRDRVHGVLYRMDPRHKPRLDDIEGLGRGYEQKSVTVRLADGTESLAITFYATHVDPTLRPYLWYLEHVLRGARENRLPDHYQAAIALVQTVDDPDPHRHAMELAIYPHPAPAASTTE
ncbi:MAG: gamma-glutamylcyclotransferase family protein [Sedimenticolaceae bacterium]